LWPDSRALIKSIYLHSSLGIVSRPRRILMRLQMRKKEEVSLGSKRADLGNMDFDRIKVVLTLDFHSFTYIIQ